MVRSTVYGCSLVQKGQVTIDMARIVFGADVLEKQPVLYCIKHKCAFGNGCKYVGSIKNLCKGKPTCCLHAVDVNRCYEPHNNRWNIVASFGGSSGKPYSCSIGKPGAPALMGSFASTMSMQSGAPTFGTPEAGQWILAAGQLARRLGVPLHTVGTLSASKIADAQSQQEGTWGLIMSLFAGANVINHATGWLEGGLVTSFEKTMMDADLCGKLCRFFEGIDLSENAQAMDAIAATGPGQHFLGSEHTQANFLTALFRPDLADNNSYEHWQADGQLGMTQRANALWKDRLENIKTQVRRY